MDQLLAVQYENIKGARQALFDYCGTLNADDLFKKSTTFNDNSISDLLVHNANTYISWLNNFGLKIAPSMIKILIRLWVRI